MAYHESVTERRLPCHGRERRLLYRVFVVERTASRDERGARDEVFLVILSTYCCRPAH